MNSYTITWDGKLLGCEILGIFYTEAFKIGFEESWLEYPKTIKLPDKSYKCKVCHYLDYCKTCYAIHYSETDSLSECPIYFYEMAQELKQLVNKNL